MGKTKSLEKMSKIGSLHFQKSVFMVFLLMVGVVLASALSLGGNIIFRNGVINASSLNVDDSVLSVNSTSNRVGIGTTNPAVKLQIAGNTTIGGNLNVTGTSYLGNLEVSADQVQVNNIRSLTENITFKNSSGSEVMRILDNGNIGIGIGSPATLLHVEQDQSQNKIAAFNIQGQSDMLNIYGYLGNYTGNDYMQNSTMIYSDGVENLQIASVAGAIRFNTGGWSSNSSERMRIGNDGNVGIGTLSPGALLDLQAIEPTVRTTSSNGGGYWPLYLRLNSSATQTEGNFIGAYIPSWSLGGPYMVFHNQNHSANAGRWDIGMNHGSNDNKFSIGRNSFPEYFIIDENGSVGMGTLSPKTKLDVNGTVNATAFVGDGSGLTGIVASSNVWNKSGTTVYLSNTTDNVGIGTTNPQNTLEVEGKDASIRIDSNNGTNPVFRFSIDNSTQSRMEGTSNGNLLFYSTGSGGYTFNNGTNGRLLHLGVGGKAGFGTIVPNDTLSIVSSGEVETTHISNPVLGLYKNGSNAGVVARNTLNDTEVQLIASDDEVIIGSSSNTSLIIRTGNQDRMFIANGSGNVGIGTNSPLMDLQVGSTAFGLQQSDASPNAGYLRFGDNTGWKFHIGRAREGSGQDINTNITGALLTINDNGSVGIGTTNPVKDLHVGNGTDTTWLTYAGIVANANGSAQVSARNSDDDVEVGMFAHNNDIAYIGTWTNHDLRLRTNNADVMTLTTGGNVGIGTTIPSQELTIVSSEAGIKLNSTGSSSGDGPTLVFNNDANNNAEISLLSSSYPTYPNDLLINQVSANDMIFATSQTPRMLIQSGGNVGIGTTSPSSILHLVKSADSVLTIESESNSAGDTAHIELKKPQQQYIIGVGRASVGASGFSIYDKNTSQNVFVIENASDYVGINTNNPNETLHVSGTIKADPVFGEIYRYFNTTTQVGSANSWINISTLLTSGESNLVGVDTNNSLLVVQKDGYYRVDGSLNFYNAAGSVYELGIEVNGVLKKQTVNNFKSGGTTSNARNHLASFGYLSLSEGDNITLAMNSTAASITMEHGSLGLHRIN